MSVRRVQRRDPKTGKRRSFWFIDIDWENPSGTERRRVRKVAQLQNKRAAEEEERQIRRSLLLGEYGVKKKLLPTFHDWFHGRYWTEWVIGMKNKPSSIEAKKSVYKHHLEKPFGSMRLDQIGVGEVAAFRAALIDKKLSDKTINNVLTILSKPLRYAVDVEVLVKAPKVGLLRVEEPEIEYWELDEYRRLLAAAEKDGPLTYVAACLAGEAGLRVGEVAAVRWREDIDMVAKTITVNQQMRRGIVGTPKGRTRRTVPMTSVLFEALKNISTVREGLVVRNLSGQAKNDQNQLKNMSYRLCRLAGLPERGWHTFRHTFGTCAALFGVNPWRLMTWMGHKELKVTLRYVHVAENHRRDIPRQVLDAVATEVDPDRRVLGMLGARRLEPVLEAQRQPDGNTEAQPVRHLELVRD